MRTRHDVEPYDGFKHMTEAECLGDYKQWLLDDEEFFRPAFDAAVAKGDDLADEAIADGLAAAWPDDQITEALRSGVKDEAAVRDAVRDTALLVLDVVGSSAYRAA